MHQSQQTALAAFLLRVSLGLMYLTHGILLKLMTFGLAGTAGFFTSLGLPAWLAYLTIAAESVGGALLVIGWNVRVVALVLIPTLLGAIIWVHGANGWVFSTKGGGWEYPAFLIVVSVAVALLGEGAYSVSSSQRRAV